MKFAEAASIVNLAGIFVTKSYLLIWLRLFSFPSLFCGADGEFISYLSFFPNESVFKIQIFPKEIHKRNDNWELRSGKHDQD